ncbi:MAG TPA: hypothetical protein VGV10_05170 [Thermoleophilaceae bacterium]|nr:hypothetical protein [Thermoleophilaceae bacterium]
MIKRTRSLALLVAAGALLAVPAVGQANHKDSHDPGAKAEGKAKAKGHGKTKGNGPRRSCAERPTVNKGFVVKGTVVSYSATTPLVITVTKANRHARLSGQLGDASPLPGVQFSVPTSDTFKVRLKEYEAGESPGAGDAVRIIGKVAVTRKKCVTDQQDTLAKRYGAVDVRKVKFTEVD